MRSATVTGEGRPYGGELVAGLRFPSAGAAGLIPACCRAVAVVDDLASMGTSGCRRGRSLIPPLGSSWRAEGWCRSEPFLVAVVVESEHACQGRSLHPEPAADPDRWDLTVLDSRVGSRTGEAEEPCSSLNIHRRLSTRVRELVVLLVGHDLMVGAA